MRRLRVGFSHNYLKLHNQTCARLLDVKVVHSDDIPQSGLDYDTEYRDADGDIQHYKLESGVYLRMTFIGCDFIPFTTYRKHNEENWAKYVDNIGCWFEIYVKESKEDK